MKSLARKTRSTTASPAPECAMRRYLFAGLDDFLLARRGMTKTSRHQVAPEVFTLPPSDKDHGTPRRRGNLGRAV